MNTHIRPATPADLPMLHDVERSAGMVFAEAGMPEIANDPPPTLETLARYRRAGRAWVAADPADRPGAYVIVDLLTDVAGTLAHIEQVSVHPRFAHQGVGAALIEHVGRWASDSGCVALTLTTFAHIPWNAPYYGRLGFRRLRDDALPEALQAIREREAGHGLDRWPRVCMRRDL